jgi:hypothetical protein
MSRGNREAAFLWLLSMTRVRELRTHERALPTMRIPRGVPRLTIGLASEAALHGCRVSLDREGTAAQNRRGLAEQQNPRRAEFFTLPIR